MLKLIGSIMVVSASAFLGMSARRVLSNRVGALDALGYLLDYIRSELSYQRTPLPQLFRKAPQLKSFAQGIAAELEKNDKSFAFIWSGAVKDLKERYHLNTLDCDALNSLGGVLGRYSAEEQCKSIAAVQKQLEKNADRLKKELKSKGQIYNVCAVGLGLLVVLCLL